MSTGMPLSSIVILIIPAVLSVLILALMVVRMAQDWKRISELDKAMTVIEFITMIGLTIFTIILSILYVYSKPTEQPGCQRFVADYGIIASNVDVTSFILNAKATYPANTFADAVSQYRTNQEGTGYFAWDGVIIRILTSNANQLSSSTAPKGNYTVYSDQNVAII